MVGFHWWADGTFAFLLIDTRLDGLEQAALTIESAGGSSFNGDAAVDRPGGKAPERGAIFLMPVADRRDLEKALVGDLTFNYHDRAGRQVSVTAPFGLAVPRTGRCMAAASAAAAPEEEAETAGPSPEARARLDPDIIGNGSGAVVDLEGHVITNAHVVQPCGRLTSPGLGQAEVVAVDKASDLALLRFTRKPAGAIAFRSGRLRLGETVIAAGFPLNDMLQNGLTVTVGNLSALSGMEGDRRMIQFSAPTTFGNSGGPLMDSSGRLVGLVESGIKAKLGQNLNYAVAVSTIQSFLDENGVTYGVGQEAAQSSDQVASKARRYAVLLECRK